MLALKGWSDTPLRELDVLEGVVGASGKCAATKPMDLSVSAKIWAVRARHRSMEVSGACRSSSSCRTSSWTRHSSDTTSCRFPRPVPFPSTLSIAADTEELIRRLRVRSAGEKEPRNDQPSSSRNEVKDISRSRGAGEEVVVVRGGETSHLIEADFK